MRIIKVTCKDGKATVEVDGCVGQSCQSLTEQIERALGTSGTPEHKPEFYQGNEQTA